MNYAIDTANFDVKQHISLCKLLMLRFQYYICKEDFLFVHSKMELLSYAATVSPNGEVLMKISMTKSTSSF